MVREGTFREDLLYRINTIHIEIPPLRERGKDVLLLADSFLQVYGRKYRKPGFVLFERNPGTVVDLFLAGEREGIATHDRESGDYV